MTRRIVVALLVLAAASCGTPASRETLRSFPLDGRDTVLTESGVAFDPAQSADGKGSLRLTATAPTTFRLFEVPDLGIDHAQLVYEAKLRTQDVKGPVYLEMWCNFPGKGEFFARGLQSPLEGTVRWTSTQTSFFLRKGDVPDRVKLNVVVNGTGTVWVDQIRLTKGPFGRM